MIEEQHAWRSESNLRGIGAEPEAVAVARTHMHMSKRGHQPDSFDELCRQKGIHFTAPCKEVPTHMLLERLLCLCPLLEVQSPPRNVTRAVVVLERHKHPLKLKEQFSNAGSHFLHEGDLGFPLGT